MALSDTPRGEYVRAHFWLSMLWIKEGFSTGRAAKPSSVEPRSTPSDARTEWSEVDELPSVRGGRAEAG